MKATRAIVASLAFLVLAVPAWGQLDRMLKGLGGLVPQSGPSDAKIASGL